MPNGAVAAGVIQIRRELVSMPSAMYSRPAHSFMSLLMIFADGSYAGKLEEFVQRMGRLFGHGTSVGLGIIKNSETRRASSCCPDAGLSNAASAGW